MNETTSAAFLDEFVRGGLRSGGSPAVDLRRRSLIQAFAAMVGTLGIVRPAFAIQAASAGGQTTWDLTELYASDEAWETDRVGLQALISRLANYRGRLGDDASSFYAALQARSDAMRKLGRMRTYAQAKANEDLSIAANQKRNQVAQQLSGKLERASAFVAPEIVALGRPRLDAFLATDNRLTKFRMQVDDVLRQSDHILGEQAEGVIAATALPFGSPLTIVNQMNSSDIPRPVVTLSDGTRSRLDEQNFQKYASSSNRADRKLVFEGFMGSLKPFEATLGLNLLTQIRQEMFTAQVRRYPDALSAALGPLDIPVEVFRTYVEQVNVGLPAYHRYLDLRRRLLDLPELAYYDLFVPVGAIRRIFTPEEMRANLLAAVRPLGPEYVATLTKASAARWTDPLPRPNKFADNYNDPGAYDVHPYLFFNLTDDYGSMTDYAHEWGHAMHAVLADAAQPYETSAVTNFIAEVPSQLNEILLARHMIDGAPSREEKLFYCIQLLDLWSNHFFTTGITAEFQDRIHAPVEVGEALTGEALTETYFSIQKRYYGRGVDIDPVYGVGWARNFQLLEGYYTFQYATCITAAGIFSEGLLSGDGSMRDRYLKMLRAGGSNYAYDLLRGAGVDLVTVVPYQTVIAAFSRLVDEAEALAGPG